MACGSGIFDLMASEGLTRVAGQVEFQPLEPKLEIEPEARTFSHYAIRSKNGLLIGASHERDEINLKTNPMVRAETLAALKCHWPQMHDLVTDQIQSRRSIRVMARDYQPVQGWLSPRLGVITGLGSRGFSLAPYLAFGLIDAMIKPDCAHNMPMMPFWGLTRKGVSFSLRSS